MSAHNEAVTTKKSVNETSSLYLAESGGMTNEAVIISCGGIAASHLQNIILKSNISKVRVRLRKAKADFDRKKAAQTSKAEEQRIL